MLPKKVMASMTLILLSACVSTSGPSEDELEASIDKVAVSAPESGESGAGRKTAVNYSQGFKTALRDSIIANPSFKQSLSNYREAQAGVDVARSGGRVQGSLSATTGAIAEGGNTSDTTSGVAGDVSLSKLLFDGGVTRASVSAASARTLGARYNAEQAGNEAGMEAARAWVDVWQYSERLTILRSRIKELEPLIAQIESLKASGIIDRAALASAERKLIDVRLEEETLLARLTEAQERFNEVFGAKPASLPTPSRLFTASELQAMKGNVADAPQLQVAAAGIIATAFDADAARARTKPTVSVRTGVNSPLSETDDADVSLGLVFQYNYSDGGRRKAEIEALEQRLAASKEGFEEARRSADSRFAAALASTAALWKSWDLVMEQTKALEVELETIRSQIGSGQASISNLVETEIEYYRALTRRIEIEGEIAVTEIGIAGGVGRLLPKLGIDVRSLLEAG